MMISDAFCQDAGDRIVREVSDIAHPFCAKRAEHRVVRAREDATAVAKRRRPAMFGSHQAEEERMPRLLGGVGQLVMQGESMDGG
jgi:hypothetical protein